MNRQTTLLILPLVLVFALSNACSSEPSSADKAKEAAKVEPKKTGLLDRILPGPEMLTVPAGTAVVVRLTESLSTEKNNDGDRFGAILDRAIAIDGKVVAPVGSPASGTIYHSKRSGKVKGRAEMGLTLTALEVGGKTYKVDTTNWFRQASGTKKKDAAIIGGGAGVGALIGAVTGGKKGAAIGAAVGGGAGTAGVVATRGKPVALPAESRLTFRLEEAVQLPVQKK